MNCSIFRLESFGDLVNATQARNYLRFCRRNPETVFTLWTKNPWILEEAIKAEGKPRNFIVVLSAETLDYAEPEKLFKRMKNRFSFIDKMFFVYRQEDERTNCGGRKCIECRNCYRLDGPHIIREALK